MDNKELAMEIDLRELFQIFRKRIWVLIGITFTFTTIGFFISFYVLKPVYEAKVSVVIIKAQENIENQQYDYNDIIMYQDLIKTYAQIAKSRTVAEKAVDILRAENIRSESLLGQITAKPQEGTQIMDLMVKDSVPFKAKDKLIALTDSFIKEATRIYPNGNIQIIDEVRTPQTPISPNKRRNVILALALGIIISFGVMFFLEMLDNTIKSEEDIEKHLEITVLGVIPIKA